MELKAQERKLSPAAAEREANPRSLGELAVMKRETAIQQNGIESMEDFWIAQGWYKVNRYGELRLTYAKWQGDPEVQIEAIRTLVNILGKDPWDMTQEDFRSNRLGGLLGSYFKDSPYAAITESFPELEIRPWEMSMTPMGFYMSKENRVSATKWLLEKLQKDPKDVLYEDFHSNRLGGLLAEHYNDSPYAAITEAFPELEIRPWEMIKTPMGTFESEEMRVAAIRWLVEKLTKEICEAAGDETLRKDPRDITTEDFISNRLWGLLFYYSSSRHAMITEAFPELEIKPWEMAIAPKGFYNSKENRVAATKWLVDRLHKDPKEITAEDFFANRLSGLLDRYDNSPFEALLEVGLVAVDDEYYMRNRGRLPQLLREG